MSKLKKRSYYKIGEAAILCRIHPITAYNRANSGTLPGAKKVNGFWQVTKAPLLKSLGITEEEATEILEQSK